MAAPPEPLRPLAEAGWDDLLAAARITDPFRRMAALRLLAERAASPIAVVVGSAGEPAAAAALEVRRERGLRVIRHLGEPTSWYDPTPPARDAASAEALASRLSGLPGDVLTLAELSPEEPLVVRLVARGARLRRECPTYRIREADIRGRLGRRRRESGRLLRRAGRGGAPVRVDTLRDWTEVEAALPAALALHLRRWEGRTNDPMVSTEEGRRLAEDLIATLGREGDVRLTRVDVGGRLAAFALSVVASPGAVMYRTAHDRQLPDGSGLGATALVAAVDALDAEGVTSVDLGSGGDAFKRNFADPEPLVTVQIALSRAGRVLLGAAGVRSRLPGAG